MGIKKPTIGAFIKLCKLWRQLVIYSLSVWQTRDTHLTLSEHARQADIPVTRPSLYQYTVSLYYQLKVVTMLTFWRCDLTPYSVPCRPNCLRMINGWEPSVRIIVLHRKYIISLILQNSQIRLCLVTGMECSVWIITTNLGSRSATFLYNSLPAPFITTDPDLPREIWDQTDRGLCLFIFYLCDYNSL